MVINSSAMLFLLFSFLIYNIIEMVDNNNFKNDEI